MLERGVLSKVFEDLVLVEAVIAHTDVGDSELQEALSGKLLGVLAELREPARADFEACTAFDGGAVGEHTE